MNVTSTRRDFIATATSLAVASVIPDASAASAVTASPPAVKALTFDVFGTVVDWRTSIIREGQFLTASKGIDVDWGRFADAWRAGYRPAMDRVRKGELPWTNIDGLHRMILDDLLVKFGIRGLSAAEIEHLNFVWHRLMPWPDSISGLNRLRSRYTVSTLSNGNVGLLVDMAKHAGLPWDCVLSAEMSGHYKPDLEVYQTAARLLGLAVNDVMMVAAHRNDLEGAKKAGMRTAFVTRPLEWGLGGKPDTAAEVDIIATDFVDLADKLGM